MSRPSTEGYVPKEEQIAGLRIELAEAEEKKAAQKGPASDVDWSDVIDYIKGELRALGVKI